MDLDPDDFWALLRRQHAAFTAACDRHAREPGSVRRSLLLGYGTVRPAASVAAYEEVIDRAEEIGFDEVVVYGPFQPEGSRFWSDADVHARVLSGRATRSRVS